MKRILIDAGLISAVGLVTAAPAVATPDSTVSCSPVILCSVNGDVEEFMTSVNDFVTEGPKTFVGSIVTGPRTFSDSVNGFVTQGPKTFVGSIVTGPSTFSDSVNDFVKQGPKTFVDSIKNPSGATE